VNAKGAFYLFPNISRLGLKSTEFCAQLLDQQKSLPFRGLLSGLMIISASVTPPACPTSRKGWTASKNSQVAYGHPEPKSFV